MIGETGSDNRLAHTKVALIIEIDAVPVGKSWTFDDKNMITAPHLGNPIRIVFAKISRIK
jgi:hypothetical protein